MFVHIWRYRVCFLPYVSTSLVVCFQHVETWILVVVFSSSKQMCFCILQVFAINRDAENPQKFSVEYVKGALRTYLSTDRWVIFLSF